MSASIPETGQLDWEHFEQQVNARTKLVAVGAASNAIGTISDVRRAADLAHSVGALAFVDAVHYAPHTLVDVRALECDFLACSSYKFYGPHTGILFGRHELLAKVDFPKLIPAPDEAPDRVETGTQSFESMAGAAAAVDFLASLGHGATRRAKLESAFGELHRRGSELFARMWTGLQEIPGVRTFGPAPGAARTPTIAFTVQGHTAAQVARALVRQGVFASDGHFYAMTVIDRLGLAPHGVLRAGCACYTTEEEVDRLLAGVRALVQG